MAVKITHVWKDGTTSDTVEGHVIPKEIAADIYKLLEANRRKQQQEKAG